MAQTKSPAHTAECRKVLDPTRCSCHVGAYTDQHPFICTNHQLAWHYTGKPGTPTCAEFDEELNEVCGFTTIATDPLAVESRLFKVRKTEEVRDLSRKLASTERDKRWYMKAFLFSSCAALAGALTGVGSIEGWW